MAEPGAGLADLAYPDLQRSDGIDARLQSATRPQIDLAALETTHGELGKALSHLQHVQTAAERGNDLLRLQFPAELGRLQLRRGEYSESKKLFEEARRIGENSWSRAAAEDRALWSRAMASIYRGLVECEIKAGADDRKSTRLNSS